MRDSREPSSRQGISQTEVQAYPYRETLLVPGTESLPGAQLRSYCRIKLRVNKHRRWAEDQAWSMKWLSRAFALGIPVLAATITFIDGFGLMTKLAVGALGLLLTVIGVVNATSEPARRYQEAAQRSVELHDLDFDLDLGITRYLEGKVRDLDAFLDGIDNRLSVIGRTMASSETMKPGQQSR